MFYLFWNIQGASYLILPGFLFISGDKMKTKHQRTWYSASVSVWNVSKYYAKLIHKDLKYSEQKKTCCFGGLTQRAALLNWTRDCCHSAQKSEFHFYQNIQHFSELWMHLTICQCWLGCSSKLLFLNFVPVSGYMVRLGEWSPQKNVQRYRQWNDPLPATWSFQW